MALELIEGKNRQVRRMTAAVGHPTLRLMRRRIGNFVLTDLAPGKWRELAGADVRRVRLVYAGGRSREWAPRNGVFAAGIEMPW